VKERDMDITVYTFRDAEGDIPLWSTQDADEAQLYAWQNGCLVEANTYTWQDSEPVAEWDYRKAAE
jgi:hypothetical protein